MDLKKTGTFLAQRRREKSLTQAQLAAILGVTDKAVSRWETGRGFPDVSVLPALAAALEVTVADLVNGEMAAPTQESRGESAQEALLGALSYAGRMRRSVAAALLAVGGVLLLLAPLVVAGIPSVWMALSGALLLGAAALLRWKKGPLPALSPRAARLGALGFLAAALVLACLPRGVAMNWGVPPGEAPRVTYHAYFDLLPFAYGNFFPLLTAALTALLAAGMVLLLLRPGAARGRRCFVTGVVALAFSAAALLFAGSRVTAAAVGISLCLLFSAALQAMGSRGE